MIVSKETKCLKCQCIADREAPLPKWSKVFTLSSPETLVFQLSYTCYVKDTHGLNGVLRHI